MRIALRNIKTNRTPTLIRLFAFVLLFGTVMAQTPVPNVQAAGEQLILTKTIEGGATTAQVGDVIRYRIRFECSSLTGPCGQMEITDVLQAGLIYLPPPNSSVPSGFSISYNSPTRTITITKDDNNLLDGSQYDAVIAVQIDYDLRPLPAAINNTINGRIDPPGPASWINATPAIAPTITIGTVTPSWDMTKSLFSPIINPTVNTDVTYQIQLCPITPPPAPGPGNVPLRNITITDTLPGGATFVSASNGGTESSGTVTWPVVAGPIYPPNCVARFVTIRYNTPAFSVGNNVTNTANASGVYTASGGGTIGPVGIATDPITHPIIAIAEIPTYSKDDTGDPVGINGTARFVLNLNTNLTNYPTNEVALIDNLPPQLQVTEVTSGEWDVSFNYVRAYVEYSTNNDSSYTTFAGQPIIYNTNATYAAPAANITNVRWRFEYDPDGLAPFNFTQAGLPYTWSFTTSPQIRITPRAIAATADPPSGAALPAAVSGTTYDNCLQITRRNSSNTVVTDPCNIESMTVQGNFVSLRTSKNETPGASWDDLDDPLINTFTADGTILPGDTLRYTITVEVTERSSAPLINPTIQDTLPAAADFVFVRNGTAKLDGTPLATQPTFSPPVAGKIQWDFSTLTVTPLALGSHFLTVEFFAYIPRGQAPNTYTNNLYVVTDSVEALCETPTQVTDAADIDLDGNLAEPACQNPDNYVVERSAALRGEKWIRSTDAANSQVVDSTTFLPSGFCPNGGIVGLPGSSNPFTRYPCISQAFPEGALSPGQLMPPPANTTLDDFEYNLRIFNDGNIDMLSFVLYDIMPFVGDTGSGGTLSSSARLSEFRPTMRGPVEFISGPGLSIANFTIEYNNTTNPCRPEVFNQSIGSILPAGCNNTWTTTWSSSARSYRIRLNTGSAIPPASTTSEVRFGVPMYIPADAPTLGTFNADDAQSLEIAWNSFSHVGAYDKDPGAPVVIQDLLASEPRKVGITIPERMSVGNRVWRDSDNSGTINAPDDTTPGIAGVTVSLYRDSNGNGLFDDGPAIARTTTDVGGYYLFSNIPFDSVTANNNLYYIGIPASNFLAGQPLESLRSSTGTPTSITYTTPPSNAVDSADDGIDPTTLGQEVFSVVFTLQPTTEPATESDLSANNLDGPAGRRRGGNGERNDNSDLTLDFGFFGGTDIPFSIGNHVWFDDGSGVGGVINDGIRQSTELPVVGLDVRLYRDGNSNGIPEAAELIRTDITDANGFYLFDNLDPGRYFIEIPASEFGAGQPLAGWHSSQPTGTEITAVNGGTTTADIDSDNNGINTNTPETNGVFSGVVILARGVDKPTGETHLSNQADPDSNPVTPNLGINPTEWDGPISRGRYGETDITSNLTIDFGFIPPMSLGNRVWIDEGAGTLPFPAGYNNGLQDGTEAGVASVRVELWQDTNGTLGLQTGSDTLIHFTLTDAQGYYLFDRLQPGNNYFVHIPASNFTGSNPLQNYFSSFDANQITPPADNNEDTDDNGIDNANPATNGITSSQIVMAYNSEPLTSADETDINNSGTYGPQNRGNFGQTDSNSNLTIDFGFIPFFSLGNRVWFDTNNNSTINGAEVGVDGVRVQLFASDGVTEILVGADGISGTTDDASGGMLTANDGYYRFNNLQAGDYVVSIPSSNFGAAAVLEDHWSSATTRTDAGVITETTATLANTDTDSDDNGTLQPSGAVTSSVVTLGPAISAEPAGETNLGPGGQGQPDTQANMTVDFGFYTIQIGNVIWNDANNSGLLDGTEVGINGVDVQLWSTDGSTLLDTVTTAGGGLYIFSGLPQGNYIVRIPATEFNPGGTIRDFVSSTGSGTAPYPYETAPNAETDTTDSDDNGTAIGVTPGPDGTYNSSLGLGAYVQSSVFSLTPGAEASVDHSLGLTNEPRIDFGVYGNVQTDLAITKDDGVSVYIAGGTLNYTIVVTNNGPSDVINAQVDDVLPPQIASWSWTCAPATPAARNCTDAPVNSAAFQDFIDLSQGTSVTYNVAATVSASATGVLNNSVTVTPPSGVAELNPLNNNAIDSDNFASLQVSKDDGLSIISAGNTITYQIVITNNGLVDLTTINVTDTLPADLTYVSANPAPTTRVGNALTWLGLSLTAGSSTTISVTAAVSASPSDTITNIINVVDTTTGIIVIDDDVDFTVSVPNNNITKILAGTDAIHTADPNVTIGEILTYEVVMSVPVGSMTNTVLLDTPQSGLAFVDLTSLIVSNPDTDGAGVTDNGLYSSIMTFDPGSGACTNCDDGITIGTSNPLIENNGIKITFGFGTLTNTSAGAEIIAIRYTVVVLDITSNQQSLGTTLTNNVTWSWEGNNSVQPTPLPTVNIVEPEMTIDKNAQPLMAPLSAPITFTIDISHSALSFANAFDVVVTDVLPPGLAFITGSEKFTRTSATLLQAPVFTYNSDTTTLTFVWDEFPLGQSAQLEFQASFVGPSPVDNSASVQWTSLEIDPTIPGGTPVEQSQYNVGSTERWHNPLASAGLNVYSVSDSISIQVPQRLPRTGFAPGIVTQLPVMPAEFSYAQIDLMLEIPRLDIKLNIVGVPFGEDNWNLNWLSSNAGWLEGSAFPTYSGNSAITAHSYLADGTVGPFVKLNTLGYGDQIIVHLGGLKYIYEVRQNLRVNPNTISVLKHEEISWLTLITCQTYNERTDDYIYRIAVRAVLVKVE